MRSCGGCRGAPPALAIAALLLAPPLWPGAQGGLGSREPRGGTYRARLGRPGLLDEVGMPERIGLGSRSARHRSACDTIGRALDAIAPLFQGAPTNSTAAAPSQPMFHPRLRGDWRGAPVALGDGQEMVTRAGAARRYNFWLSGKLPWTQWSEYDVDEHGELVRVNMTQRREWDERYGIGGHPGWLGWGGLSMREYAVWLRERYVRARTGQGRGPNVFNIIYRVKERTRRRKRMRKGRGKREGKGKRRKITEERVEGRREREKGKGGRGGGKVGKMG